MTNLLKFSRNDFKYSPEMTDWEKKLFVEQRINSLVAREELNKIFKTLGMKKKLKERQ